MNTQIFCRLAAHNGRTRTRYLDVPVQFGKDMDCEFATARWRLRIDVEDLRNDRQRVHFTAEVVEGAAPDVAVGLVWRCDSWSTENYVLIPGAVYAGNRFSALRRPYPPAVRDVGQQAGSLTLDIGDIPRLSNEPGLSYLDQTSFDAAIPALGVHCPATETALLLLTPRMSGGYPIGLEVIENDARDVAEILLLSPGFLHPPIDGESAQNGIGNQSVAHRHPENTSPVTLIAGESIRFSFEWHEFKCPNVPALFARVFQFRSAMFPEAEFPLPDLIPFSAVHSFLEEKHNAQNWDDQWNIYKVGIPWLADEHSDQAAQFWQNGWCGGPITAFALSALGGAKTVGRCEQTLNFIFSEGQAPSGFFKAIMSPRGVWKGDGLGIGEEEAPLTLARRQGDTLYFLLRYLFLLKDRRQNVDPAWIDGVLLCANALCDLWEHEKSFGFLIDHEKCCVAVNGSTSGSLIPAALVLAYRMFSETRFLETALAAGKYYRDNDLAWGVTTGGPGDALQAPDGESIFGLIESFVALAEMTEDSSWMQAAVDACHQAASWVISFPVQFPPGSALAQLSMDARGTMIANAQNKCGVPGICTLSGEGIFRAFRATGDVRLLHFIREIAHSIPQFLSRQDRSIPTRITWGHPLKNLPEGWICERVNITPSWPEPLGEQAAYSCWCEVAMLLTACDLPGVYCQPDTGLICCFDHVEAQLLSTECLQIKNPTPFTANVRLMVESSNLTIKSLPQNFALSLPTISIPPNGIHAVKLS